MANVNLVSFGASASAVQLTGLNNKTALKNIYSAAENKPVNGNGRIKGNFVLNGQKITFVDTLKGDDGTMFISASIKNKDGLDTYSAVIDKEGNFIEFNGTKGWKMQDK